MAGDEPDQNKAAKDAKAARMSDLTLSLKAIKWVFIIVFVNFLFYIVIVTLHNQDILGGTVFPTFLLFLALALSFGILLIIGLRQAVDLSKVENEWIKKIAINPVMAIVAVLLSILASFSPLADMIIPANLDFMLANVSVRCDADDRNTALPPIGLLAVIYSEDPGYIKRVNDFLKEEPDNFFEGLKIYLQRKFTNWKPRFANITFVDKSRTDENYRILRDFETTHRVGSGDLPRELSDTKTWIAYTSKLLPDELTSLPIPTIYDKFHHTHLFLVYDRPPDKVKEPAVGLVDAAASLSSSIETVAAAQNTLTKSLSALFEVEIDPKSPHGKSTETDLKVELFYDSKHVCWFLGG
jgi:hypothetical protein